MTESNLGPTMNSTRAFKLVETVRQECRLALLAYQHLRTALNEADQERIFLLVEALVQHAAQVGCFLVPSRPASAARGEFLRRELKVEPGSALLIPALRGTLGPGDASYEDWVDSLETPHYLELSVMPQGALAGSSPDVFQRRIDPDSLRFGYRHCSLDLNRVGQELRRLEGVCQAWLRAHTPW
jgi:hypothetical protein